MRNYLNEWEYVVLPWRTNMHPPTKTQADIGRDNPKLDASDGAVVEEHNPDLDHENKDMARQEFANEADINYMLSRFNVTQPRGAPQYGEWDDTIDLQIALESVRTAREGYDTLPDNLKERFPRMEDLLRAVENGSLVLKDEKAPTPVKTDLEKLQDRVDELQGLVNTARQPQPEP